VIGLYGLTASRWAVSWPCAAPYAELPVATRFRFLGQPDDRGCGSECGPAAPASQISAPTLAGVGLLLLGVSRCSTARGWFNPVLRPPKRPPGRGDETVRSPGVEARWSYGGSRLALRQRAFVDIVEEDGDGNATLIFSPIQT